MVQLSRSVEISGTASASIQTSRYFVIGVGARSNNSDLARFQIATDTTSYRAPQTRLSPGSTFEN